MKRVRWMSVSLATLGLAATFGIGAQRVQAAESGQELAKKLSNPVANLISVPFQGNYDGGIGPEEGGQRFFVNVQPVIPVTLTPEWNVISRTILPITWQDDIVPGAGDQFGIGDVLQSLFLSPQKPTAGGLIWGAGPVFLIPTATDDLLGSEKWGIGPTGVVLRQEGPWTYGALANHIWSVAGNDGRKDISSTFLQPFVAHTTPTAWTFSVNTETTYDWKAEKWSVPVNGAVSKLLRVGGLPVQVGGGIRYWVDSPPSGPEGFGVRLQVTLLLPR